ncbi:hypothetical protein DES47_101556 [Roseateles toxinivorans]|uniref:Uncharacterized protein n=1 Tax=Roseateles toxinivorans TaxID=270368 RepID=A0A4R6QUT0_9BURK|nr:hypothetical protein DES47_101556 [Roseateles toxinivorans]
MRGRVVGWPQIQTAHRESDAFARAWAHVPSSITTYYFLAYANAIEALADGAPQLGGAQRSTAVNLKAVERWSEGNDLDEAQRARNRNKSKVRARV